MIITNILLIIFIITLGCAIYKFTQLIDTPPSVRSYLILSILAIELGLTPDKIAKKMQENHGIYADFWNKIIEEQIKIQNQYENNKS